MEGIVAMLNTLTYRGGRTADASLCHYSLVNGTIHQLAFTAASLPAVRDWQSALDVIYANAPFQTVLTLTDASRSILPPMGYAAHLSTQWLRHQFTRTRSRNAILHPDGPLAPAGELALAGLPGYGPNLIRYFHPGNAGDAIRWLVSDD